MKRTIYIATILLLILGACRSSKKVVTPPPVIITNTDSVRTEYIETVRIDTVTVEVPVPAESVRQIVQDSTSHLETSLAESDAWLNPDGSLGHSLNNKAQPLNADVLVPVKDTRTDNSSASIREVPVPYEVPVEVERNLTTWEKFRLNAFWYMIGLWLVTISFVLCKYVKRLDFKF